MLKNKLFVFFFLVSVIEINAMQHIFKKISPANSKVVFGWGINAFISSVPLLSNFVMYFHHKKRMEKSRDGRYYIPFSEEKKYIKRLWQGQDIKNLLNEYGIDPNAVFELKELKNEENLMRWRDLSSTKEGKIIISKENIAILKQSLSTEDSILKEKRDAILFKLLKAKKSFDIKTIEKQIINLPVVYTTGMLAGQLVAAVFFAPFSLLSKISYASKISSYAHNSYIVNGFKGYFKGDYASKIGFETQKNFLFFNEEDFESYDIDCDPEEKDRLFQAAKDDCAIRLGNITQKVSNMDSDSFFIKEIKESIVKEMNTISYYQEKNKKDHPEVFVKKN